MNDFSNPARVSYDIPPPVDARELRRVPPLPWRTIGVGGSFFAPSVNTARCGVERNRVQQPLKVFIYKPSREEVNGRPVNGARVWRLEDRTPEEARKWFEDRGKPVPIQLDEMQAG